MDPRQRETSLGSLGNYELLEEIGRGSFGTVYRARHWQTGRAVAVKVPPATLTKNPMLFKRFQQECLLASKIDHPNIVRVLEYSFNQSDSFLVMELVEGVSLGERLEREGRLPEAEAVRLMVQACQGLEQIHSLGLLHRDIKPDNILVTTEGVAKITDLGLAKNIDAGIELTKTGTGLGTPNFIAPEQFRNAKNVDLRCDIYALGATLYQLVTGTLPFADTNPVNILVRKLKGQLVLPQQLVPGLGERTINTILRALSIDPEQRFSSCWEFAASLVDTGVGLGPEFDRQAAQEDMWYVLFEGPDGKTNRATGHAAALVRATVEGKLGDLVAIHAARSMAGPFKQLHEYPELVALMSRQEQPDGAHRFRTLGPSGDTQKLKTMPGLETVSELTLKETPAPVRLPPRPASSSAIRSETFRLPDRTEREVPRATSPSLPERPAPALDSAPLILPSRKDLSRSDLKKRNGIEENESVGWTTAVLIILVLGAATFFAGQFLTAFVP